MSENNEQKKELSSWEPKRGWLREKEAKIPKDKDGNPKFGSLGCETMEGEWEPPSGSVLEVFSQQQVVYLVNKALYFLNYQREHHVKRAAAERERLAPIKKKVHELFHISYINATEAQLAQAVEAVRRDEEG